MAEERKRPHGATETEEEEIYEVEVILEHKKIKKGKYKYYLKWKGYPDSENTWEIEENLACPDLLEKYWEGIRKKKEQRKKEKEKIKPQEKEKEQKPIQHLTKLNKTKKKNKLEVMGCNKDANGKLYFLVQLQNGTVQSVPNATMKKNYLPILYKFYEDNITESRTISLDRKKILVYKEKEQKKKT